MTKRKFTDDEIIKVLECCITNGASCKDCPAFVKVDRSNCKKYFRGALDLINRQKAEIERLEGMLDSAVSSERNTLDGLPFERTEAIEEFAERVCEDRASNDPVVIAVKAELKEMLGEQQ